MDNKVRDSTSDPIQQTISTALRSYIHSPGISRKDILTAIQRLNVPQPNVYVKTLRKAYDAYLANHQIAVLLEAVNQLSNDTNGISKGSNDAITANKDKLSVLKRDDLKLICFEYIWH